MAHLFPDKMMTAKTNSGSETSLVLPRRDFLRMGITAVVGTATLGATSILAAEDAEAAETVRRSEILAGEFGGGPRTLAFRNTHTGEELTTTFWKGGSYEQAALDEINYILRDFRTGDVHPINRGLLNVLSVLKQKMNSSEPVNIISGYRSPRTNAGLRSRSEGVARRSFHLRGMAIDLRLPGRSTAGIAHTARQMSVGGVGYYDNSDFVHVDVGPVRTW